MSQLITLTRTNTFTHTNFDGKTIILRLKARNRLDQWGKKTSPSNNQSIIKDDLLITTHTNNKTATTIITTTITTKTITTKTISTTLITMTRITGPILDNDRSTDAL